MKLHGENVALGDRVYDVTASRGFGNITKIEASGLFEVRFDEYSFKYYESGIQVGKSVTTLYWNKPVVIKPKKDEVAWVKKQELLDKILNLVRDYAEYV